MCNTVIPFRVAFHLAGTSASATMMATLPLFRRPRDQVDGAVSDVTARRYAKMDFELPDYYRSQKSLRVLTKSYAQKESFLGEFHGSNTRFFLFYLDK